MIQERFLRTDFPGTPVAKDVDTTSWGRVPTVQAVVHAFDNDPTTREYQDVGLDGLRNVDEQSFLVDYLQKAQLIADPAAYAKILTDPSNDDFHYFRGTDYDAAQLSILERYKKYNGQDGNSPTAEQSDEDYPTSGTTLPDMEDINRDNTLSETESYFQYKVNLRPEAIRVGSNFVVDEIEYEATFANGTKSKVKWYQFKIPITEYLKVVGPIRDFKSIRFMRMFMRGFEEPVILRFAELDLVRAEWRKYNISFMEGAERVSVPEATDATFEISSVSIEENAGKEPVNYVLPPGFDRVTDPQNPQLRQLNEQSMVLRVMNLEDGDARAAFRNVNLDIRQYRRLRMEVHAEAITGQPLKDNELTAFVRIGSDYKGNFYEYEIPLRLTPPGFYDDKDDGDRAIVWPIENSINIDLSLLQDAKQERNRLMNEPGSSLSISDVFVYQSAGVRISVSGNPNLSNVKVIMVGVRNPIKTRNPASDDGNPKYAEIWVNELRLNDFREDGGWAANAHLQARLADFGTIDMVGQTSTPGFGSIDKKVNERSMERIIMYDLSSTFEMGKFFNEDLGVRLPVYMGYSQTRIKPQYNPLDPDILLDDALDAAQSKYERDSISAISDDLAQRKTFTISNAGITKRGETPHFYDLANLSANYTYNETYKSDTKTEINLEKNYRGGLGYDYEAAPPNIAPFKNVRFLNSPVLKLFKDFNFYPYPKTVAFRTELSRYYNELKTRNINNPYLKIQPSFRKDFLWTRFYDLKYDITRMLKFDFTATNLSRIDEPTGGVDKYRYGDNYEKWKDSVMVNFRNGGRTTNYNHFMNVTYTIPVNKLPLLSWLNSNVRYTADYTWLAGSLFPDSMNINLGNSIKNHSEMSFTAMANMSTIYNKWKFLKTIENNTRPDAAQRMKSEMMTVTYTKENLNFRPNAARIINHNLKSREVVVKVTGKNGEPVNGKMEIVNENRVTFTADQQSDGAKVVVEGQVKKKRHPLIVTGEFLVRALMGVRSVSLTYTTAQGQFLPGYLPQTDFLGMSKFNNAVAPGWPFIFGYSDDKFFEKAITKGWLSRDTLLNTPALANNREDLSVRVQVEPFPGLRIDLNSDRRYLEAMSAYFIADNNGNFPDSTRNKVMSGSFSMSIISWGTSFEDISQDNNYVSETFEAFKDNRVVISERRAADRQAVDPSYDPDTDPVTGEPVTGPYKSGYGPTSREVLLPAFLAAYTKTSPSKVTLETFPSAMRMMPNWRINFDGLSKFEFVQKWFRSINLMHQYRSTYQINSYTTNLQYTFDDNGLNYVRDLQNNYIQLYEINVVTINEQFSPMINVDMNWKSNLTTRFEWKKSRTVSLNLTSNQIADARVNELIFGAGYRFDDVQITLRTGGGQKVLKSDLNLRFDLSIRDNKTLARKLVENVNQPVVGQRVFSIGTTADYVLSDRFNLQIFADHTMNNPFVANTFPTSNTNFGFSLKFTLVQ